MFDIFKRKKKNNVSVKSVGLATADSSATKPTKDRYIERSLSDLDTFYRVLWKDIAIIGAIVRRWHSLCATESHFDFDGKTSQDVDNAREVIQELDNRLYSRIGVKEGGIRVLTNSFFDELFIVGRFGIEFVPLRNGSGIDYIRQYNTYSEIQWADRLGTQIPFILKDIDGNDYREPTPFFYYNAFNRSFKNPAGHSLLHAVEWVARIEEQLLLDMAVSSHNIGNPRLHMKIGPPDIISGEHPDKYTKRVDAYFDNTVDNFGQIEVDQNIFTWDNVEIGIVGAHQTKNSFVWDTNFSVISEEIISAMGLYPWTLGLSHGATKNWVEVQYNTLLTDINNLQLEAATIAEFLANLELKLKGINVKVKWIFAPNENPNIHKVRGAEAQHFQTVHNKVLTGYISKDAGARELGYGQPHNNELINLNVKPIGDQDKHTDDDEPLSSGDNGETGINKYNKINRLSVKGM